ncbi:MAG: hypothetical protein HKN95_05260 [Acidimicrobiia bacterium]|nr:hypothetical protein [Acidimicrobiia bacterium]
MAVDGSSRATGALIDRLEGLSQRGLFLLVAGPIFVVYLLTATWSHPMVNDAFTNSVAAWNLGTHGSVYLEEHEVLEDYRGYFAWIIPAGDSVASKYPPGAAVLAAPIYAVWPEESELLTYEREDLPERVRQEDQAEVSFLFPPPGPAALTAAATTAIAIGLLALVFLRLGGTPQASVGGAYLAGLGTSAWAVAADQLWQHGPAMLWIALALLLSDRRLVGSGIAYGAAILTRPPVALIAAGSGLLRAFKERSLRPAILVGAGSVLGLVAFLAYNWWLFGDPSISAGYGTSFQDRVGSGLGVDYLRNLFLAAFSVNYGMLVWSPFLLVLLPGLRDGWKAAPPWARGAFLGGIVYLLIQYKANRASGGVFLGYRYPLEALTAAAPVLFLAYTERLSKRPPLRRAFIWAAIVSVAMQLLAALDIQLI